MLWVYGRRKIIPLPPRVRGALKGHEAVVEEAVVEEAVVEAAVEPPPGPPEPTPRGHSARCAPVKKLALPPRSRRNSCRTLTEVLRRRKLPAGVLPGFGEKGKHDWKHVQSGANDERHAL